MALLLIYVLAQAPTNTCLAANAYIENKLTTIQTQITNIQQQNDGIGPLPRIWT